MASEGAAEEAHCRLLNAVAFEVGFATMSQLARFGMKSDRPHTICRANMLGRGNI